MKLNYAQSLENFSNKFHLSKEETHKGTDLIPGGFSRRTFGYGPHAIFVEQGEAQYITTIEGVKLLDLNNNFAVNVLGHNHPEVVKVFDEALTKGYSFGNPTKHELELAKVIAERIESIEQVKFFCSASEACLGAVRIARGYTGKNKIAKFEGGYHGFTDDLAISAHPNPNNFPGPDFKPKSLPDSDGIPEYKVENVIMLIQNDFAACEKIIRNNADDLACIILELQSCAGGIVVLEQEFISQLRQLTNELGILLIFDETITLRAAYGGLQSLYPVNPDLTVLGKMIGGGLPIGAVGGSKRVFDVVEKNQVMLSGTHHGHPLACAAGLATLKVMDKDAYARLNQVAERVKTDLNCWAKENKYPFIVFGAFSVLGYTFTKDLNQSINTHRDFWHNVDEDKMSIYALEMATRGFYPVHRGQLGFTLPMTDEDIDNYIQTTKEIIADIYS